MLPSETRILGERLRVGVAADLVFIDLLLGGAAGFQLMNDAWSGERVPAPHGIGLLAGFRFVDLQGVALDFLAVQSGNGRLGVRIVRELDEAEALRATVAMLFHDLDGARRAVRFHEVAQLRIRGLFGQVSEIHFHVDSQFLQLPLKHFVPA